MKSERRHDLESNELARRLETWVDAVTTNWQPLAIGAAIIAVGAIIWTGIDRSSVARDEAAWNAYRVAVEGPNTDFDALRRAAEQHAGSSMSQFANAMWADGQVLQGSFSILRDRDVANEALSGAVSVYQSLVQSSSDEALRQRALLGLARIYEIRSELDRAREYYGQVTGAFREFAEARLAILDEQPTKESIDWLATAKPPVLTPPVGPGTPGATPEFSVDPLDLSTPSEGGNEDRSLGEILDLYDSTSSDRYGESADGAGAADDQETDAGDSGGPALP